jgi:hypothetical protein
MFFMKDTVKFLVFKWGNKYSSEYVNRLYNSIKKTYSGPFEFYCFTDDADGLRCNTIDISTLPNHNSKVFTACKLDLFNDLPFDGPYALLDLDLLILKDLKLYFDEYQFSEPRFIECAWQPPERIYESYYRGDCYINSSFVTWNGDQLKWVYDRFYQFKDLLTYKIKSFDKFLFYTSRKQLTFHPNNIVYAYSFGSVWPDVSSCNYRPEYYVSIFNTSHNSGVELHDAEGWARDLWLSND